MINEHIAPLTDEKRVDAFIIDDSFYSRARSKKVELLSWVRDHADSGKSKKGFRMLSLGWADRNSFIPVAFELLSSKQPKSLIHPTNEAMDKRTVGYKRRVCAQQSSPECFVQMLAQAMAAGIKANYVLFDSWFSFPSTILKIRQLNLHVIAMIKNTSKIHYYFEGKRKSLGEIFCLLKKRPGRSKYLASTIIELFDKEENRACAKIFCPGSTQQGKMVGTDFYRLYAFGRRNHSHLWQTLEH